MSELTLVSTHKRPLKPLVQAALENELRLLEAGIRRTEKRLSLFETKYRLSTTEFIRKYENDELEENLEFAEWVGEQRMLARLLEKKEIPTYPHHKHDGSEENVLSSSAPDLEAVLDEIQGLIELP